MWPLWKLGLWVCNQKGHRGPCSWLNALLSLSWHFHNLGVSNFHFPLGPTKLCSRFYQLYQHFYLRILWNAFSQASPRDAETGVVPSNLFKKPSRWLWHKVKTDSHCLMGLSIFWPIPKSLGTRFYQLLLALLIPFSPPEILWANLLFEGNQYFLIFSENFRLLQCIPLFQEGGDLCYWLWCDSTKNRRR